MKIFLVIYKDHIFYLFVYREEIVGILEKLIIIYYVMLISDYVYEVEIGILIAIGNQVNAFVIIFCGYWHLRIPL